MTQLILNISDESILPTLKDIVSALKGVSILTPATNASCELDLSLKEARDGHVMEWDSVESLIAHAQSLADAI